MQLKNMLNPRTMLIPSLLLNIALLLAGIYFLSRLQQIETEALAAPQSIHATNAAVRKATQPGPVAPAKSPAMAQTAPRGNAE